MVIKRKDPLQVFVDEVEVAIIGGGTCGVICAARCAKLGISYKIIDRQITVGGVWLNYANNYSSLQVRKLLLDGNSNCSIFVLLISTDLQSPCNHTPVSCSAQRLCTDGMQSIHWATALWTGSQAAESWNACATTRGITRYSIMLGSVQK